MNKVVTATLQPAGNDRIIARLFWVVTAALVAIAAGAFVMSYSALRELAAANGAPVGLAWIWPLIVDTSMLVYTAGVLVANLQRRPARLPVALTILYSGVTVVGNILHAPDTALGWFVAALPPVSLVLGAEMLRVMGQHIIERQGALETLSELRQRAGQLAAEVEAARQNAAAEMAALGRQTEAAQAKLEVIRAELSQGISSKKAMSIAELNAARHAKIEERRGELLTMLPSNLTQGELAERLGVSVKTVRQDLKALNGKADAARGKQ